MTKKNTDPRHQGPRHYFRPFPSGVVQICLACGLCEEHGNHCPLRQDWKEAMQALAVVTINNKIPTLLFRPIDLTRITRTNLHPLNGRNVMRGLYKAGVVQPASQAGLPRRGETRGRAASWWRVTPEGWAWLKAPSRRQPKAVQAAHAGGSAPLQRPPYTE